MLKSCWDCIAGDQGQSHNEDPYRVQLNGRQGSHLYSNGNMFVMPIPRLEAGNEISMTGHIREDGRLRVEVRSDSDSLCYINVVDRVNETDSEDLFELVKSNEPIFTSTASKQRYRDNATEYKIEFIMREQEDTFMMVKYNESYVGAVPLNFEDIKYITFNEKVETFSFDFKSS